MPWSLLPDTRTRVLAERLAGATFGGRVQLDQSQHLGDRAHTLWFRVVSGPSGAPASVVVKRPRSERLFDPAAASYPADAWLLFNEWAALGLLSRTAFAASLAPRLYAGDRVEGLLLLEDLGVGVGLDTLLLGRDPDAARAGLLDLARALGRLHAGTRALEGQFERLRSGLGPGAGNWMWLPPWLRSPQQLAHVRTAPVAQLPSGRLPDDVGTLAARLGQALRAAAAAIGVALAPAVDDDLQALAAALGAGDQFRALAHGDPCPGNEVIVAGQLKLVDFELAAYRPALLDGAYARMHFPTCWCVQRLPPSLVREWETAYRAELIRGFPTAADDALFGRALVAACAYWALTLCQSDQVVQLFARDRRWGSAGMRQRVLLRLASCAQASEEFGQFPALGGALRELHARLGKRWPRTEAALPLYPAFQ